ncbi:MAG: hypothetical protein WC700_02205 [Gemmatimonadaceae bacterium]|jgi:hypothetical protein
MNLTVTLDVRAFQAFMTDFERRQLPYATMLALNATAADAQRGIKNRILSVFTVRSGRSSQWLFNQVWFRRRDRATKAKLSALVTVGDSGDRQDYTKRSFLPAYESGFLRRSSFAIGGSRIKVFPKGSIAIPNRGANGRTEMPRELYPTMLGLQERRDIAGGMQYVKVGRGKKARMQQSGLKGKRRTFVVRHRDGAGQVRQRVGPGKLDTILLFRIRTPRTVAPRHFFFETAQRIAEQRMLINLRNGFAEAMRTAR